MKQSRLKWNSRESVLGMQDMTEVESQVPEVNQSWQSVRLLRKHIYMISVIGSETTLTIAAMCVIITIADIFFLCNTILHV